jgi:hypothetical protein
MKYQIEILEDLFKMGSHSEGVRLNLRTNKSMLIQKKNLFKINLRKKNTYY